MAKKKWYRVYVYLALESVRWFIYVLPRSFAQKLAAGFGSIGYVLLRRHRKSAIENLKFAFGDEKSADELAHIARRNFVHLSQTAADMCRLPKWTRSGMPDLVHAPEGTQALDQALAAGRGAIVLTGHLGNWELLGPCLRFLGYPGSLVGRRIYYEPYDRVLVSLRRSGLVETIYRDESPRQILEVLKRNHLIGMTTDQDIDSLDGIFIPFLGRDALTAVAPAKISLASGAPILPTFLVHDRGGYRLWLEEAIWPDRKKDKGEEVNRLTRAWSRVVERYVRTFPDQWVWMHRRWKTEAPKLESLAPEMSQEEIGGPVRV